MNFFFIGQVNPFTFIVTVDIFGCLPYFVLSALFLYFDIFYFLPSFGFINFIFITILLFHLPLT